uniref:EamA domain-containing protein n=1 Tax=Panagrellus redivivus TaxID=6233 RepID=A0A7E4USN9_PANRE
MVSHMNTSCTEMVMLDRTNLELGVCQTTVGASNAHRIQVRLKTADDSICPVFCDDYYYVPRWDTVQWARKRPESKYFKMFGELDSIIQLFLAVFIFGSMFVPIKQFDAGDGFYSQWIMSISILLVGFGIFAYQQFTQFYPLAMLGGAFWAMGNMMSVPIMKRLGMALGILIWNSTNCIVGWAVGTFGLFGIHPRPANNAWLTAIGLVLIFAGAVIFTFVKNKAPERKKSGLPPTYSIPGDERHSRVTYDKKEADTSADSDEITPKDRIFGICLALLSGSFFGINMAPVIYIQDNVQGASADGLSYAFSQFTGAFIVCAIGFVGYAIYKKNKPAINPQISLPALVAGACWAIAQTLTLRATSELSASITYPITSMIPGCIASLWSIFYFREIEGARNLAVMGAAIVVTLAGAICIGAAK